MKIVIHTAIQENYGEYDFPHWKAKGGQTYVIDNCSKYDPHLASLIEVDGVMYKEFITSVNVQLDSYEPEDLSLFLVKKNGQWHSISKTENTEDFPLNEDIQTLVTVQNMETSESECTVILKTGITLSFSEYMNHEHV